MSKIMNIYVSSSMGCVRQNNEDIILTGKGLHRDEDWRCEGIFLTDHDRYVVAVCDGMGGHNAGEIASEDVATQLAKVFSELPENLPEDNLLDELWQWHEFEHEYLNQRGRDDIDVYNMGTTLVTWFVYEDRYYWANCGDSRIFRFRDNVLTQLSKDHSLFQKTGNPDDEHVITNCMGGGCSHSYLEIVNITNEHRQGDVYILCSDGLTDMLSDAEISSVLESGGRAKELTLAACEAGGRDNVSVCVVETI
ncbi:MAG: serine/threonine-protein phosphatase [Bacteroidaceae bacterium]|nr:serine/threonine-protein phosphatase [Bacteroidaceae bacterium]